MVGDALVRMVWTWVRHLIVMAAAGFLVVELRRRFALTPDLTVASTAALRSKERESDVITLRIDDVSLDQPPTLAELPSDSDAKSANVEVFEPVAFKITAVNSGVIKDVENELADIESAMRKLDEGTYGLCEVCNEPIDAELLVASPIARHCHDHVR